MFLTFCAGSIEGGMEFHNCVNKYLRGYPIVASKLTPNTNKCLNSIEWILKDITDVSYVETLVIHPKLGYKGVIDCIAKYR